MGDLSQEDLVKLKSAFGNDRLGVKVQSFSKDRTKAMLVLYLQHTDVADRLEEVDPCWSFEVKSEVKYAEAFVVHGKLTVKGVSRENAGDGDDPKSAYSDAFKRCAMLFGVGRYLYDSELVWVPHDEQRDKFKTWTPEEYWSHCKSKKPPTPPKATSSTPPVVKPKVNQNENPAIEPRSREILNGVLTAMYRPYLNAFPQTKFSELLQGKYNVHETRLMTREQMEDLASFMEGQLKAAAEGWDQNL